jgi:hypothetical protein
MRKVQVITRNRKGRPQRFCRRRRRGRLEMLLREANRKVKKYWNIFTYLKFLVKNAFWKSHDNWSILYGDRVKKVTKLFFLFISLVPVRPTNGRNTFGIEEEEESDSSFSNEPEPQRIQPGTNMWKSQKIEKSFTSNFCRHCRIGIVCWDLRLCKHRQKKNYETLYFFTSLYLHLSISLFT